MIFFRGGKDKKKFLQIPLISAREDIALDISDVWVKIAKSYTRFGKAFIHNVEAVESQLGALRFRPKTLTVCMPRRYATIRFLKMPSHNEQEIENMLEFETTKQLPFSREEIVWGWRPLKKYEDGYSRVMLAIVPRKIIEVQVNGLKNAGLSADFLALSTEAIFTLFLDGNKDNEKLKAGPFALLDVDYEHTELLICDADDILFTRSFPEGAELLQADAAAWSEAIKGHISQSVAALAKDKQLQNKNITAIFVSGGAGEFFRQVSDGLSKEFSVPVEYYEPPFASGVNMQRPFSFSSVTAAALLKNELRINLLPAELKARRVKAQARMAAIRLYALSTATALCILLLLFSRLYEKQLSIKELDKRTAAIKPDVEKIEVINEKLKIITSRFTRSAVPLDVLKELHAIAPAEVTLSMFSIKEDGNVMLRGTSKAIHDAFKLVAALESSANLKNVKLGYTNKRKLAQEEVVDFQINCILK